MEAKVSLSGKPMDRLKSIGIIPARMASSRFPGKPLADINGVPLVGHVYYRTKMSALDFVCVATCDTEIEEYVKSIGGHSIMTLDTHEACTDRTSEALLKVEAEAGEQFDIIVMVQGDEPMILPSMIDAILEPFNTDPELNVANMMGEMQSVEEYADPNQVKVVTNPGGYAMYFSREPIPSSKKTSQIVKVFRQFGLIAFRRNYLIKFNQLEPTPLERIESVDMLRVLEYGDKIKMVPTSTLAYTVDTEQDRQKVASLMKDDPLIARYNK